MIRALVIGAAALLAVSSTPAFSQARVNSRLAAAMAAYERIDRAYDPLTSSSEGDRAALRRLPDASREAELAYRDQLIALKGQLARIDVRGLRGEDALNRNYLMRVIDDRIAAADLDFGRAPISNGDGFFTLADGLAYTTPIQSGDDAEAWISRLEALGTYYEQSVVNARRGIATGYVQPRIVADRALATMRAQVGTMTDTMLAPLAQMPQNIPAAQQESYRARAREIVQQRILPAHQAALQFMEREYLPASRSTIGLRAVPGGEALYRYLVHNYTTTDMTPEQIHALGEQEVARIFLVPPDVEGEPPDPRHTG